MPGPRHEGEDSVPVEFASAQDEVVPAEGPVSARVSDTASSRENVSNASMTQRDPGVYDPTPVIRGYDSNQAESVEQVNDPSPAEPPHADSVAPSSEAIPATVELTASTPESVDQSIAHEPATPAKAALDTITAEMSQDATTISDLNSPPVAVSVEPAMNNGSAQATPTVLTPPLAMVDPLQDRVRKTWSLMFGSRYEEDDALTDPRVEHDAAKATDQPNRQRQSSLRTKLDRERRLAEQIQTSTRSRRRPRSDQVADPSLALKTTRRRPKPVGWQADERPFEAAGLLATSVRFCIEKAMNQAVACLAELRAIAQGEPKPIRGDAVLGVFLTQWELNQILTNLFHDHASSSLAAVSTNLYLDNPEYASLPLETLLAVSWFLPLDDFAGLRHLVAEISRRRLSDTKLALLNSSLHRHFVLRPFPGVRMQRLLLRVVEAAVSPVYQSQQEEGGQAKCGLVVELLHALHLRIPTKEPSEEAVSVGVFLQLSPCEVRHRFHLSSVLSIQRVLFFRFFIQALATQQANQASGANAWWPRSTGKPRESSRLQNEQKTRTILEDTTPLRSVSKRKKKKKRVSSEPGEDDFTDAESDRPLGWSTVATRGSAASPSQELTPSGDVDETPAVSDIEAFTKRNDALSAALTRLVRAHPWLVEEQKNALPLSPAAAATRASFLAAETFQQSVSLLTASSAAPIATSILAKMDEFTAILDSLATRKHTQSESPDPPPPEYVEPVGQPETITSPPPRVQRANSSLFPPPYVPTSPAYWAFDPEIPVPLSTTPKQLSVSKANASPGVGAYDICRSEKLTFQQRAGHSFAKAKLPTVEEPVEKTPMQTPVKRDVTKRYQTAEEPKGSPLDPPAYTHWASAAASVDAEKDSEDAIDAQVRDALRLQSSLVLDDLVQTLLHRGKAVGPGASRSFNHQRRAGRPDSTDKKGQTPSVSRVVSRVRTIAAARTTSTNIEREGRAARTRPRSPPPYEVKQMPEVKEPPRDYEPPVDDAHLQWATRVSVFYKAQLKAASGGNED